MISSHHPFRLKMYRPFKELKPTTMVVCMSLNSEINLGCIFGMLRVLHINPDYYPKVGKNKVPVVDKFGAVILAKFMGVTKGIASNTGCFKNSITMTMSTGLKNVCIKLYKDKFHICGIDSNDLINPVKDEILRIIREIREMSEYCKMHSVEIEAMRSLGDSNFFLHKGKIIDVKSIDSRILELLVDMKYSSDKENYIQFVNWLATGPYICEPNFDVLDIEKAMVNYNYHIGFRIIKPKVEELLDGVDDFICRYDPNSCFVTVSLPYTAEFKVIKKKKKTVHTFMVYNTGEVTQSGPNEELMEAAYEKFMKKMWSVREEIMSGDTMFLTVKHL